VARHLRPGFINEWLPPYPSGMTRQPLRRWYWTPAQLKEGRCRDAAKKIASAQSISANHHQLFVVKKQLSRTARRLLWLCIRPVVLRIDDAPRTKPTLSPQWLPRSVVGQRRVLGPERETVPAASRGVAMGRRSCGALLEEAGGPKEAEPGIHIYRGMALRSTRPFIAKRRIG